MNEKSWKIYFIILIAITIVSFLFDYKIALGWLLGGLVSGLVYKRTETFWNGIVDRGFSTKHTGIGNFMLNYGIMALVLIISAVLPNYFNVLSCAAGLFLVRIVIIVDSLQKKEV